jgi:acyl-homoserine lactone acylase PvdQ
MRRAVAAVVVMLAALAAAPASLAAPGDTARYILPPGNYGGLPTNDDSLDQLPLYDALTPLRGNVTAADIQRLFLPENFWPIDSLREEQTGRAGLRLLYDGYGVPHVYGQTRADMAFGAGWATARDRGLLVALGRGPSRAAVADVPNLNAFGLVTSGRSFVPSPETEALVSRQAELIKTTYGAKGHQIIADAQAYADGITAYWEAHNVNQAPATVNDVIAVTAFIGSIFGAGGGGEAANGELLAKLRAQLGATRGYAAWQDVMLADDPEAPTSTNRPFSYGPLTGGNVRGSLTIDPGSIQPVNATGSAASAPAAGAGLAPARERASNWLLVAPQRSATRNTLATMGPQLGYYYPEIVQQIHLDAPGIRAQGVAVPGLAMYVLIGRTANYAWSLTSAGHDVRDVYAEELCEPNGSAPTRASTHYRFRGTCRAQSTFNAGLLDGTPVRYQTSVHGPVFATATIGGKPYALSRKRSTFGRDGLNLAALKDMTEGKADTPERFYNAANQFGFTFNWAYASRTATAMFSSGLLPRRPEGLDRRLVTRGNGSYEWAGFLSRDEHPHDIGGPNGLLRNWNNRSAPGFMHGDDEPYGSAQRVELFDKYPNAVRLPDNVSIMNRAATEDVRSPVWPVVSDVLRTGPAPSARAQAVVDVLDDWVARDAPRLDADVDGFYDDAGPGIMDAVFRPLTDAVMTPVFGDLLDDLSSVRGLNGQSGHSYVDKDLRTLLNRPVRGKFNLRYCGNGSLPACRSALWAVIQRVGNELAFAQASEGRQATADWRFTASRTGFQPGLIPNTIRATNRPTFQQVIEFQHP